MTARAQGSSRPFLSYVADIFQGPTSGTVTVLYNLTFRRVFAVFF